MYTNILVPIDASATSNLALQEAIKLAKVHKATIHLVHIVDIFILTTGELAPAYPALEAAVKETGQALLDKMEKLAQDVGVPVKKHLIENIDYSTRIPEKIIEECKNQHSDLIIIGTHGRRGFNRFLLGSVAEGVIRMSNVPVLLIRSTD